MFREMKEAFARSYPAMLTEAAGLLSLVAMLVVGLNLPELI
ncbi:MAG: hypothetical protein WBA91_11255 [Paracoccaceae bacterium]